MANKRLEELSEVVQTNRVQKLDSAIAELKTTKDLVKKEISDIIKNKPEEEAVKIAKEFAPEIKALNEKEERVFAVLGIEPEEVSEPAEKAIVERVAQPLGMSLIEAAAGIVEIAKAGMEGAMRNVSIEQGYDPRDFAVVAYGGAGPLVAADLARALGAPSAIVPLYPGAFSAFGMLAADVRFDLVRSYLSPLAQTDIAAVNRIYSELTAEIVENLANLGHLVLKFTGETEPEMPGDVCVQAKPLPAIETGMVIRIED